MKTKLSRQMNNKKLKKEIEELRRLTAVLCCALYEKSANVQEYIKSIADSVEDCKKANLKYIIHQMEEK